MDMAQSEVTNNELQLVKVAELKGHADRVWCCAWSPDGKYLATSSGDKTIRIWEQVSDNGDDDEKKSQGSISGGGKWVCKQVLDGMHKRTVRCVAWSPTGRAIASCSFDASVAVWELIDGEFTCSASLEGHDNEVKWLAWSASGSLLATCGRDKTVWIWQLSGDSDWECLTVLSGHSQDVKQVKFHPSDEALYSASYDNTVKVWSLEEDDWYNTFTLADHTSTVWSIAFSPNASYLASGGDDLKVNIYQAVPKGATAFNETSGSFGQPWRKVATIDNAHTRTIYSLDWSQPLASLPFVSADVQKHGLLATCAGDDSVSIIAPHSPTAPDVVTKFTSEFSLAVHVPRAHGSDVNCVQWNPKRPGLLASASDDKTTTIWELRPKTTTATTTATTTTEADSSASTTTSTSASASSELQNQAMS